MGSERTDSNQITRDYFDSLMIEMRHIDSEIPDTKIRLFGQEFSMPIATAALSHLNGTASNGMAKMAEGAKLADALCFSGMGEAEEIRDMCATGAKVIKIVKPHAENEKVFAKIREAEEAGAFGVGMDIDHAFSWNGEYDNVVGLPMKPKSLEEMRSFVESTKLPFIVKGVLSVQDAIKCLEIGASGIIVSHHHGIMKSAVPPLLVLPKIKEVIGDRMPIFVDCCIESGMDAFKALALGADAVCVGRAIMDPLKEKGAEGVCEKLTAINQELKAVMERTAFTKLSRIDDSVIYRRDF
ncbi:MAG: alpha-hydroxy-acid oxidizing protein [Lachnospiraceae bacterium]|nr:alpha-hydroxy-acid oxidizing protein [Lachnospiraceae bacterium]MBQ2100542.1 alpha-hydroxy-acid oxidizing protein [Lachnospiraceae bacterium]